MEGNLLLFEQAVRSWACEGERTSNLLFLLDSGTRAGLFNATRTTFTVPEQSHHRDASGDDNP
jgi:hypothetical protein